MPTTSPRWPRSSHFIGFAWVVVPLQVLFAKFVTPPLPDGVRGRPWVIVANHRSMYDVMVGMVLFRRWKFPITMLVTDRYFENRLYRWMLAMVGAVPIDPSAPLKALRTATAVLESGRTLLLMPEGKLAPRGTPPEDILDLEPGAAMLATRTGAGVIIGAISHSDEVWPPDAGRPPFHPWRRPTITVTTEVIQPGHGMTRTELTQYIATSLRRQLARSDLG